MDSVQSSAQNRKPIIYIVGFLSPRDVNRSLFAMIPSREDYPMELRNHYVHGAEGKRFETMTYEDMADDVIAYADSLGFKTFDVGGYCFGGRIAYVTAARYPDRVTSVHLIETSFGTFRFAFLDLLMESLEHIYQNKLTQAQTLEYLDGFKETQPLLYQLTHYMMNKTKPLDEVTAWRLNYDIISVSYKKDLLTLEPKYEYRGPVQIILGENTVMEYSIDDYVKAFPNLDKEHDITKVANGGHNVGLENPQGLADAIESFYKRIDAMQ